MVEGTVIPLAKQVHRGEGTEGLGLQPELPSPQGLVQRKGPHVKAFYNPHGVLHGATTNQVFLLPVVLDKVSLFAFNPCSGQACTSQQLHYMFARRRHV